MKQKRRDRHCFSPVFQLGKGLIFFAIFFLFFSAGIQVSPASGVELFELKEGWAVQGTESNPFEFDRSETLSIQRVSANETGYLMEPDTPQQGTARVPVSKTTKRKVNSGMTNPKPIEFNPDPSNPYPACVKAMRESRLFNDVLKVLQPWTLQADNKSTDLPQAVILTHECLCRKERANAENDAYLEKIVKLHSDNWEVLAAVGMRISQLPHFGVRLNNQFVRNFYQGDRVWSQERDYVRALQLMRDASVLVEKERKRVQSKEFLSKAGNFYQTYAGLFQDNRSYWELQILTSLDKLPDYTDEPKENVRNDSCPVDAQGNPIWYSIPASFDKAKNDGERCRFLLGQAISCAPDSESLILCMQANYLQQYFGVQTLANYSFLGDFISNFKGNSTSESLSERERSIWDLSTLSENETIARLATGIKRFSMPDDQNYMKLYLRAFEKDDSSQSGEAGRKLADEYKNRRQYTKAAEIYRKLLDSKNWRDSKGLQEELHQITGNWGHFESTRDSALGERQELVYSFRNGKSVELTAYRIKVPELLAEMKDYLESIAEKRSGLEQNNLIYSVEQIGYKLLDNPQKRKKFLGEKVKNWTLALQPSGQHFNRKQIVTLPFEEGGAYWVEARMQDGNADSIVVWINDLALVSTNYKQGTHYYVADALTGAPVPEIKLDFFGYNISYNNRSRVHPVSIKKFSKRTDSDGSCTYDLKESEALFETDQKSSERLVNSIEYSWLIEAQGVKDGKDCFAVLGFQPIWFRDWQEDRYLNVRAFFVSDRPVYRPEQDVRFKFWIAEAGYGFSEKEFAKLQNQTVLLKVYDSRGTVVFEKKYKLDRFGGLSDSFRLDKKAVLGVYRFELSETDDAGSLFDTFGSGSIRLEEYRKPEFEVSVDAPKDPVKLGDKINVKVNAKYYFGAPVSNGRVKYTVMRQEKSANWYPVRPWDWFYGNGYSWLSPDYDWYPGWRIWGCRAPLPFWMPRRYVQSELVEQGTAALNPDGTFEVAIDSSVAQLLYPNSDQEYTVQAEITDSSRRTIAGTGSVLVSKAPYRVYTWLDRGFYKPEDQVGLSIQTRRLDGKPVPGMAVVKIYRISYPFDSNKEEQSNKSEQTSQSAGDSKGGRVEKKSAPKETEIYTTSVKLGEDGKGKISLKAGQSGQYRISCVVTDDGGRKIEGGYLFSVRGSQTKTSDDLHFNGLELLTEKAEYAPGEKVRLLINTDRSNSTVLLFIRKGSQFYGKPKIIRMNGQSETVEFDIDAKDMPNIFAEAMTVSNGQVFKEAKEIVVPPEKRILNLAIEPSQEKYKPGDRAKATLFVKDLQGKPVSGQIVVSIYDKSVEYISGGSKIEDIRKFFWKWRRHLDMNSYTSNLGRYFTHLSLDKKYMRSLGIFGELAVETMDAENVLQGRSFSSFGRRTNKGTMPVAMAMNAKPAKAAAPVAMAEDGVAMEMSAAAPTTKSKMALDRDAKNDLGAAMAAGSAGSVEAERSLVEPTVRQKFADTAFWTATLEADQSGRTEIEFDMPENLTTWKIRVWALAEGTRVGEGSSEVITGKDLIVRMQKPRFLVQKDETVFSAIVHNYLKTEKTVEVSLELPEFEGRKCLAADADSAKVQTVNVASNGETRVEWRVRAELPGSAVPVRMIAKTDEESDAVEETIPVYIHGILKQEAISGIIAPRSDSAKDPVSATFTMTVPEQRQSADTKLTVRFSPTLAGAMLDAIPYLLEYPYGCTEQTLNRFVPLVISSHALQRAGVDLATLQEKRANLNAQELGDPVKRSEQWKKEHSNDWKDNPVFDIKEVEKMFMDGLSRLGQMQCSDGGWGWFSGYGERSSAHLTAQVVHGLNLAKKTDMPSDGELVNLLSRGVSWLANWQKVEAKKIFLGEILTEDQKKSEQWRFRWKSSSDDLDAFVFSVLAECGRSSLSGVTFDLSSEADFQEAAKDSTFVMAFMKSRIWNNRGELSNLSLSLFGLGLAAENEFLTTSSNQPGQNSGVESNSKTYVKSKVRNQSFDSSAAIEENNGLIDGVIRMLSQYVKENPENQTLWLDLGGSSSFWWRWYGNDIETQAHYLKLLVKRNPKDSNAPKIVKYLLNNRKNAVRWNSTRDTAYCLEAFAEYLKETGELSAKTTVDILLDGKVQKTVTITPDNLFLIDNTLELTGSKVKSGVRKIEIRQTGTGPIYYNGYLENFTLEDSIRRAGLLVKVDRRYYKLTEKTDATVNTADARGAVWAKRTKKYERTPLKEGETVRSGDLIEVELLIDSANEYDSILIEDRKPSGFEPDEVRSGYNGNALGAYVEYRDERVCFFVYRLEQGKQLLTYRLRAEQPGSVSALPATIWGMYAPELKGNADEFKIKVTD